MKLEWDEAKRAENLEKHGLDFADAMVVLLSDGLEFEDQREDYDETRMVVHGFLRGFTVVLVYTPRGLNYRIISMRKATPYEEAALYKYLGY